MLGYKSQHRNLGIARPCWKNVPLTTKTIVFKKQKEEKEPEDDESDKEHPLGNSLKRHSSVPISKKKEKVLQEE